MSDNLLFTILGVDKLSDKLDNTGKAADKAADRFDNVGKVGTASLLGLPTAAGLAGAGVVAGLAAVPVALLGIAAVSQSTNDAVMESWSSAGSEIADGMREATGPLADDLAEIGDRAAAGFRKIAPEIKAMSEAAGPGLLILTDGVIGLATNAVPGMRRAVEESTPAMAGLNAMLLRTGEGASDLFDELSRGAPSAGRNIGELGFVVEDLLGSGGRLVTMLSDDFAGVFPQVTTLVDQTTDAAIGLGEGGFPAVAGGASTLLRVTNDLLGALGPIAPQLGTILGVALSMSAGSKVFGFFGDAATKLGDRVQTVGAKAGNAGGAVRGLGSALSFLGPYGAVAGAALLGTSAAMDVAYGSADGLATKLMAGGRAASEARVQLAANDAVVRSSASGWGGLGQVLQWFIPTSAEAEAEITKQRMSMTALQRAQADASKAAADHALTVERFGAVSDKGQASAALLAQKQQDLRDAQYDAAQATKTLTDRLAEQQLLSLGLANDNLALRMATTEYERAQRELNETLKTHAVGTWEATAATQQLERSAIQLVQAAGQEALAHYANKDSQEAQTAATVASNAKLLELAGNMTGPLPEALQIMIARMDDATLAAHGVTKTVDEAGNAVYRLPPGAEIKLTAKDQASAIINGVRQNAESLNNNWYEIFIKGTFVNDAPALGDLSGLNLIPPQRAAGGPVRAGQTYLVGEEGMELFSPRTDGYIHPHPATKEMLGGGQRPGHPLGGHLAAGLWSTPMGSQPVNPVFHIYGAESPAATAQEVRRMLLELKRELGGGPLGLS